MRNIGTHFFKMRAYYHAKLNLSRKKKKKASEKLQERGENSRSKFLEWTRGYGVPGYKRRAGLGKN